MAGSTKMAIVAALVLCTIVALPIEKRGKKLHVEHEYGAEVAREFDAVDPLGEKRSADNKELKKAIEKVKAKKPTFSSSRANPASSSRTPKRTPGLAVKNAKEPFTWSDIAKLVRLRCRDDSGICSWIIADVAAVCFAGFCRNNDLWVLRRYLVARWLGPLLTHAMPEAAFLARHGTQSSRSFRRR
eukprot:jgi/Tetstr1/436817/TSEL_025595.t1